MKAIDLCASRYEDVPHSSEQIFGNKGRRGSQTIKGLDRRLSKGGHLVIE
jgi:hypothetical protein